jgi:hypothetical protein
VRRAWPRPAPARVRSGADDPERDRDARALDVAERLGDRARLDVALGRPAGVGDGGREPVLVPVTRGITVAITITCGVACHDIREPALERDPAAGRHPDIDIDTDSVTHGAALPATVVVPSATVPRAVPRAVPCCHPIGDPRTVTVRRAEEDTEALEDAEALARTALGSLGRGAAVDGPSAILRARSSGAP